MLAALALAGVLIAASAAAQVPARPAADGVPVQSTRATPFSGLFTVPPTGSASLAGNAAQRRPGETPRFDLRPAPRQAPRTPRSKIVCGTTLIIVGSEPDPHMVQPKPDQGVTYTMRRYPPPACGKDE